MKSLTGFKKHILAVCLAACATQSFGQLVQTNADQEIAIISGSSLIDGSVENQTKNLVKIAALQGSMSAEFTKISEWEHKYNSYLKTARGYAESLKAGTMLYLDGMRIIQSLMEVKKACEANQQGIVATTVMNTLYVETALEFIRTYRLLTISVAKGGKDNMLNGAERNEMIWSLVEQMEVLNRKLHSLAISIAYHNLSDVWHMATAGLVQKDHGLIAREAMDRWKRARRVNEILNN